MSLEKLAEISRYYGANPDYVIAGGGNTSFKDDDFLYVKASGTSLALAKPGDFVKMSRQGLAAVWNKSYPADTDAREAAVLADMMAARCPGEEAKRPSVETLLHDILPFTYVVHTHPSLVNGLTCSIEGERAAKRLFPDAIWIPLINPGYILSKAVKDALAAYSAEKGIPAVLVILLQNHGVFVAANSTGEIDNCYAAMMQSLGRAVTAKPDFGGALSSFGNSGALADELRAAAEKIQPGNNWLVKFARNNQIAAFTAAAAAFAPVASAFTPDHMVYAGSDPLFVNDTANLAADFAAHTKKTGRVPKIVAVRGLGVFGLANSEKAVDNALELFADTQRVALYAKAFGGYKFMTDEMIRFINNWEVERYRSQAAK